MQCPKCGSQNPDDAQICQSCSSELPKIISAAQRQIPMTSALAILSFGLSIMSFVFFPLILIAVIFGIVSLIKVTKSKGMLRGKGFATLGIIISILAFVVCLPIINKIRQTAYRLVCGTNMSQLGMEMLVYTNDNDDNFPTPSEWCDLMIKHTNTKPSILRCKGATKGPCNYAINKNIEKCGLKASPNMVVLFETYPGWNQSGGPEILTTDNHKGEGCNVLLMDGHVEFVKTEDLKDLKWEPD